MRFQPNFAHKKYQLMEVIFSALNFSKKSSWEKLTFPEPNFFKNLRQQKVTFLSLHFFKKFSREELTFETPDFYTLKLSWFRGFSEPLGGEFWILPENQRR